MTQWSIQPENHLPPKVTALAEQVEKDGGHALAIYQDPVGEHWQIFCLLPMTRVEPTPYQRDLSTAHVKRLHEVVKKLDRFVDPIVAISPRPGVYWTPNGNHRRAVLEKLKGEMIPAILIPEPDVAFQILALNTEKVHNLKEKSLEVIRMYRGLAESEPKATRKTTRFSSNRLTLSPSGSSMTRTPASQAAPSPRSCAASISSSTARFPRPWRNGRSAPQWCARQMSS